jgi:two-component system response regulator HydG
LRDDALSGTAIVLCEPCVERGSRMKEVLAGTGLPVVFLTELGQLARYCAQRSHAIIALPLLWPHSTAATTGPSVHEFLHAHGRRLPIIVYADTSRLPIGAYCQTLVAGAKQVVNTQAPTFVEDLAATIVRMAADHLAHIAEEERLVGLFAGHGLVGRSAAMREVFRRALKASHFTDLPVLILGETGTGKQRLAEAIHALDRNRSTQPLVTVNCSAISRTLAESELFGHVKGAFSGAHDARLGLFRAADGGTLLLDETGELDLELQPKLLRVVQEQRLLPVGEDYEHPIDVRVIAVTNRPLHEMVAAGRFRADLFQRLNVFQIRVPPLRERPEDIATQARHFLHSYRQTTPTLATDFATPVLEALQLLRWEGNSRQLKNAIWETLAHKECGALVQMEDLPQMLLEALAQPRLPEQTTPCSTFEGDDAGPRGMSLSRAVEDYERRVLQAALEQNAGNRTRTAADLGLTPRSIFNKIRKHKLA